jgi:nucleoside-diphosphate-sugar epimerase
VDDAVQVFLASARLDGSTVLNVAHAQPTSIQDLAGRLGEILGKEPHLVLQPGGQVRDLVADVSALRAALGWLPPTSLEDGLSRAFRAG